MIESVVLRDGLRDRELTVVQFLKLPLDQRIRLLLEHKVCFFDEQRLPIERQEALVLLRDLQR